MEFKDAVLVYWCGKYYNVSENAGEQIVLEGS